MQKQESTSLRTAEKLIRVEQQIAATFGKYISYDKTKFYSDMSAQDKKNFERYMENKKKIKVFSVIGLIVPLFLFSILKFELTGNAIKESIGNSASNTLSWVSIALFIAGLALFAFTSAQNKELSSKADNHSRVFDKILEKKV